MTATQGRSTTMNSLQIHPTHSIKINKNLPELLEGGTSIPLISLSNRFSTVPAGPTMSCSGDGNRSDMSIVPTA